MPQYRAEKGTSRPSVAAKPVHRRGSVRTTCSARLLAPETPLLLPLLVVASGLVALELLAVPPADADDDDVEGSVDADAVSVPFDSVDEGDDAWGEAVADADDDVVAEIVAAMACHALLPLP